VTKSNQDRR